MEFIGTKRLKDEIVKRITNSDAYSKKSMVLWGSRSRSIVERLVKECCFDYYEANKPQDGCWVMRADTTFDTLRVDDIKVIEDDKKMLSNGMYAVHRRGIFLADTFDVIYPTDIPEFISLVNTHKNKVSELANGWSLIACIDAKKSSAIKPDDFSENCEQYFFVPDFDEWADYMIKHKGQAAQIVVDYIRGDGNPWTIQEKWFKLVEVCQGEKTITTYFDAYIWEKVIIDALSKEINEKKNLNEVSVGHVRLRMRGVTGGWNTTIGEDFCNYLKDIQTKE